MEHYCINCDGFFKPNKFDQEYGRCYKCSKHQRKRDRRRQSIFDTYANIQEGDLMEWCGGGLGTHMCVVTHILPDAGWAIYVPNLCHSRKIYVWADDTLDSFSKRLRPYPKHKQTDKNCP